MTYRTSPISKIQPHQTSPPWRSLLGASHRHGAPLAPSQTENFASLGLTRCEGEDINAGFASRLPGCAPSVYCPVALNDMGRSGSSRSALVVSRPSLALPKASVEYALIGMTCRWRARLSSGYEFWITHLSRVKGFSLRTPCAVKISTRVLRRASLLVALQLRTLAPSALESASPF